MVVVIREPWDTNEGLLLKVVILAKKNVRNSEKIINNPKNIKEFQKNHHQKGHTFQNEVKDKRKDIQETK